MFHHSWLENIQKKQVVLYATAGVTFFTGKVLWGWGDECKAPRIRRQRLGGGECSTPSTVGLWSSWKASPAPDVLIVWAQSFILC